MTSSRTSDECVLLSRQRQDRRHIFPCSRGEVTTMGSARDYGKGMRGDVEDGVLELQCLVMV